MIPRPDGSRGGWARIEIGVVAILALALVSGLGLFQIGQIGALAAPGRPDSAVPTTVGRSEGPRRPGGPVYPQQDIRVRMDHGLHLAQGMRCAQCHQNIGTSALSSQNDLPTGESCDLCHGDQHPRGAEGEVAHCADCHTRVDGQRVTATTIFPKPNLIFSHRAHAARGTDCDACHGDLSRVQRATLADLPSEADCLGCHDGRQASDHCATCHPSGKDGRLQTTIGDDPVAPKLLPRGAAARGAAHDLAFVEDHVGIAKANPELCASCHGDDFCADCHAGPIRPMRLHAADYLTSHGLDARSAVNDCSSCHRLQSDCKACHTRVGVTTASEGGEESAFGVGSALRFHPGDWAGAPGALQGHAGPAQRNIAACVSCHDEDTCLACHATTSAATPGLDVSPHGAGFANSTRCTVLEARNRRVCLKCHAPGDIALGCR